MTRYRRLRGVAAVTCARHHDHGTIAFDLEYHTWEPLTVQLTVTDRKRNTYSWPLSRDLVYEGVCGVNGFDVTGIGDVTLRIRKSDVDQVVLRLPAELDGEKKSVYLIFERSELVSFIAQTHQLVPNPEDEVGLLDLDRIDQLVEEWK